MSDAQVTVSAGIGHNRADRVRDIIRVMSPECVVCGEKAARDASGSKLNRRSVLPICGTCHHQLVKEKLGAHKGQVVEAAIYTRALIELAVDHRLAKLAAEHAQAAQVVAESGGLEAPESLEMDVEASQRSGPSRAREDWGRTSVNWLNTRR